MKELNRAAGRRSPLLRYGSAVFGVAAAAGLRAALAPLLQDRIPFITLFPAIILIAWFGGLGPSLLGILLGIAAAAFLLNAPAGSPGFADLSSLFSLAAFVVVALLTALLANAQRKAQLEAANEAAERVRLAEAERLQREWFEVTLRSIGDAVIATGDTGRIQFMNGVAERLTAWSMEAARGMAITEVFQLAAGETGDSVEHPVLKTIRQGVVTVTGAGTVLVSKTGERIPIDDTSAPIRGHDGRILGAALVFRDLRPERQAEERRRGVEAQRDAVLKNIAGAFYICDREWRISYANRRGAELSLASKEQLSGRPLWKALHAAGDGLDQALRRALQERRPARVELQTATGPRWYECDVYPAAEALAVFARDITESRLAEEAQARLAAIVESADDAVISKNLQGAILTWNAGAERIYGYTAGEIIGRPMSLLVPPDRLHEEAGILGQILQGEGVHHLETVRLRQDGREIAVSLTTSPIRDRFGEVVGASHIARDITTRKQLDEQLQQRQKLEDLGVLAGGIAHDFNNLLVGVIGNASLALETMAPSEPARVWIEGVVSAGERAAQLTRQMLAYAGKGRFVVECVDPVSFVREITALIQAAIPHTVELRIELGESVPAVEVDVAQFQQLLMNLVLNAAESIPEGRPGTVVIRVCGQLADEAYLEWVGAAGELAPGSYLCLEVQDTGCGMDEATRARIFDPFFTTKFTGRGLGLSAASGIVRGHRGIIRVTSSPNEGSTFRVLLPSAAPAPGEAPTAAQDSGGKLTGQGLVLVVDDEEIVRTTAKQAL
ncbi:MAG TPA: PAS domain S-box protein, partial [Bryobacteraceae bacterium]